LRQATIERKTREVDVKVELNIDGKGVSRIETDSKFLDHILTTLAKHSLFDLTVKASGDLMHHLTEDVALTLGEALVKALGDKRGIKRFGWAYAPMDDCLARSAVDLGGRPYSSLDFKFSRQQIEGLETEDVKHFFTSLAHASKSNMHLALLYGENDHHKIEALTKALALALKEAVAIDPRIVGEIPSAKGEL